MSASRRILPLFIPHLGCPHACVFCDQKHISGAKKPVTADDVRGALDAALQTQQGLEVAFYGGSFTALPIAQQRELLDAVQPYLRSGAVSSIRLSTRPDAINWEVLALLEEMGVETVELGVQSMSDEVLRQSGRGHCAADTVRASGLLRQRGFHLILQMMTGLPGSSFQTDIDTARQIVGLRPDGVRVYPTVILRDTALHELWMQGKYTEHAVEEAVAVCAEILPIFENAGIPVIRLGLNPTEELSGGAAAGGAYHPALGELVRGRIFFNRARCLFSPQDAGKDAVLAVRRDELSRMIGQHRCNIEALQAEFGLRSLKIMPADNVLSGTVIRID